MLSDAFGRFISVDLNQQSTLPIVIAKRQSLVFIGPQPVSDRLFAIVFTEGKLGAIFVAELIVLRRCGVDVVDGPAHGTCATAGKTLEELRVIHADFDDAQRKI